MSAEDAMAKGKTAKGKRQVGLENAVRFWPTATANDATGSAYQYSRGDHSKPVLKLTGAARLVDGQHGSLNPEWVEWLMGYPPGHTACEDSETPSSRKSRRR